jgi:excisionase family DNA binding protein
MCNETEQQMSARDPLPPRLVVSVTEACHQLLISRAKIYELLKAGELTSYVDGKSRKISVTSINDYVTRRLEGSKQFERLRMRGSAPAA